MVKKLVFSLAILVLVGAGCSSQSDDISTLQLETSMHDTSINELYDRISDLESKLENDENELMDVRDTAERAKRDSSNLCGQLDIC